MEIPAVDRDQLPDIFREIKRSNLADVEKLAQAFDWVIVRILEYGDTELEIARAMNDNDALVKIRMRLEVLQSTRRIFEDCYRFMLDRKPWKE